MSNNSITNNPIQRVASWHKNQVDSAKAREQEASRQKYDQEIQKFNDAFESVAKLDGGRYDSDAKPGEVQTNEKYSPLFGSKSLKKTDQGFALRVTSGMGLMGAAAIGAAAFSNSFGAVLPQTTHESTEYQMNEKTGTIAVTRSTTQSNFQTRSVTNESFILDTRTGQARDEKTEVEGLPWGPAPSHQRPFGSDSWLPEAHATRGLISGAGAVRR